MSTRIAIPLFDRFTALDAGHWLPEIVPDVVAEAVVDRVEQG